MISEEIHALIDKNCNLPPAPMVTTKVLELINDPNSSLPKLEDIISKDSNLVSRILSLVNSAYYRRAQRIKSLRTAISLLGFKTLGNLVITASMQQFYGGFSLFDNMLWEHSVGTAVTTSFLSMEFKIMKPDEVMVAGLLHDISKTIISQSKSKEYKIIAEKVYNDGVPYLEAESEILGFTHCDVGSYLVQKWNFPIELGKVIYYHHRMDEIDRDSMDTFQIKTIALVDIANQIMHRLGVGYRTPNENLDLTKLESFQLIGITLEEDHVEDLLNRVMDAIEEEKGKF